MNVNSVVYPCMKHLVSSRPKLVFCSHPGSGPDNRRQAHCSTFVFVAPAVQQSELKTMKSSASEPIF